MHIDPKRPYSRRYDRADETTLYVQFGTTLIGESGDDFLVVRRGSKIEAVGSATQPITMTSIEDVTGGETTIGQWGGLVLLGNAPANSRVAIIKKAKLPPMNLLTVVYLLRVTLANLVVMTQKITQVH
ncbi:hypothetical protein ACOBV9_21470 (plasmid) [Pseudoalteromonas espejiana]